MHRMSRDEAFAFLAEGARTGMVATTRPDGGPHAVPVWFLVDGEAIVFTTDSKSVKARNLRHDRRIAIAVDDEAFPYSWATVFGTAAWAERPPDLLEWTTRIARRYVGDERAEEFGRRDAELDDWVVRVTIERIASLAELAS
jgi:PPOX class probable F420-dependent enzyme